MPKRLPSKLFYDERGSRLFEQITRQPEYYLTRAETRLLERHASEIASLTGYQELIELGSGESKKTRLLIDAGLKAGTLRRYVPIEVSRETVERSARALARTYAGLDVHAVVGDFERHLERVPSGDMRLIAVLGSTIGNFPDEHANRLLTRIKDVMLDADWLLLGTDLVKDREVLEAAYNDARGVTAEFNRNILNVVNERVDGDFDVEAFEHVSTYDEKRERIESDLRSIRPQLVRLRRLDLEVEFEKDELLRTEVSCKYTRESVTRLLAGAALKLEHWFTDEDESFALALSR